MAVTAHVYTKVADSLASKKITIASGTAGTWSYSWAPGDLSETGVHNVEVQVTYSNGRIQTFGPQTFEVQAQLA